MRRTLAPDIAARRRAIHTSAYTLAALCGMSPYRLGRIERGESPAAPREVAAVEVALAHLERAHSDARESARPLLSVG